VLQQQRGRQVGGVDASKWADVVSNLQEQVVALRTKLRSSKQETSEVQAQLRDLTNKYVSYAMRPTLRQQLAQVGNMSV